MDDLHASQKVAGTLLAGLVRQAVDKVQELMQADNNAVDYLDRWYDDNVAPMEVAGVTIPEFPNRQQLRLLVTRMEALEYGSILVRRLSKTRVNQIRARMKDPEHPWHGMQLERYTDEETPNDRKYTVYLNAGALSQVALADRANPLLGSEDRTHPSPGDTL